VANGPNSSGAERRIAPREEIHPIAIKKFTSLDHKTLLSRTGRIVDASTSGFLLHIDRKDIVPQQFREMLSLAALEGDQVILMIDQMDLEIGGKIARTKRLSKDVYEIAIDYSQDAPKYWRECLLELLPKPGEMD